MSLAHLDGFILDLDGTCYLGERVIPGAPEFVARCRALGKRVLWLTNNCSRSAAYYAEKLTRLGFAASPADVFTSGEATIRVLRGEGVTRVYLLGTPSLEEEFCTGGICLTAEDPQRVVAAFDLGVTYEKLRNACRLIRLGVPFVATHPDLNCPTEEGPIPDCGAICAFITASTGVQPRVVGKPNPAMANAAARRLGLPPERIGVVGDRLYTDLRMAVENGMTGILVLSGETTRAHLETSSVRPHYVAENLGCLVEALL
ncbi:MAG: HAD-IIA family hydrolase [Armatimonadota bacterium]|nr:HAD-IIA family hydrolase [Armatimonadota bacterium]